MKKIIELCKANAGKTTPEQKINVIIRIPVEVEKDKVSNERKSPFLTATYMSHTQLYAILERIAWEHSDSNCNALINKASLLR